MNHHLISGVSSQAVGGILATSVGSGVVSPLHTSSNSLGSGARDMHLPHHMMHLPLHQHLQQKAVEV